MWYFRGRTEYGRGTVENRGPDRNAADGIGGAVCVSPTVSVCQDVRESRQSCVFCMRPGGLPLEGRNAVVPDSYAACFEFAGGGTTAEGECDPEGKTAYTGAVYSLYCDNLLGGNRGNALSAGRINAYLCINSCAFGEKVL